MNADIESDSPAPVVEKGGSRWAAAIDIVLTLVAAGSLYGLEMGLLPESGMYTGALSLVGTLIFVLWLVRWRGESPSVLGLRRPPTWWFVPAWGFVVFVVTILLQVTVVPALASLFNLPQPDLSQYNALRGNFGLFVVAALGSMFTGGFIEEVIYRGLMVDRLTTILGGGRKGRVLGALACGIPFGLIHFEWGLGGIFVTAVMGSTLGLMFLVTRRNLWPLVAAHASMDFVLMLQAYLGSQ